MGDFFIADDLSGALDAGAAFHRAGWQVDVRLERIDESPVPAEGSFANGNVGGIRAAIAGFTTETRNAAPAAAAARVATLLARAAAAGGRLRFKKIDSTLRGPVAAEVAALLDALPDFRVLFAPANPEAGRMVRAGVLRVHGVPVAETEFGRDPVNPVRESVVARLLAGLPASRIVIPDAESTADFVRAVDAMEAAAEPWVGVGSGALAAVVAARVDAAPLDSSSSVASPIAAHATAGGPPAPGPTLVICGSAHPVNIVQAAELERTRGVRCHVLAPAAPGTVRETLVRALRNGGGAAVRLPAERADSAAALSALAELAVYAVSVGNVRRILMTGGETAYAIARGCGFTALRVRAEIEPGMSLATTTRHGQPALIAVKNGAFGDDASWVRAWDALNA